MRDIIPAEMHSIEAELDFREWIEAGFARLEDYLACWRKFRELYPSDHSH